MTPTHRTVTALAAASAVLACGMLLTVYDGVGVPSVGLVALAWTALTATATAAARDSARSASQAHGLNQALEAAGERYNSAAVELARLQGDLRTLIERTLPDAVHALRAGGSASSVFSSLMWPHDAQARALAETALRELALSERRFTAAQAAAVTALSRVQARTVRVLADLRDMQDRHDEAVLGDLLGLDHNVSQIGLLTDRLAVLMGGRSSRSWNRPIALDSILRGAVGRIAAYRRVRLHTTSTARVSGHAAEGLMHLLAELMDNAANFSPPTEQVHVQATRDAGGLVVTVDDKGLRMAGAALRYVSAAVTHEAGDLASLRGTRLGLAVVGRLAAKYRIAVEFRVSARGGTTAVVRVPDKLLAREQADGPVGRGHDASGEGRHRAPRPTAPDPHEAMPVAAGVEAARTTTNGLPVRSRRHPPGAPARRQRQQDTAAGVAKGPADDAGTVFGGFHRGVQSGGRTGPRPPEVADPPCQ
ncbi:sensor histidine kinase [Streptomyces griseofuscus]|uniref:ATP-binding protein n=1 Tax=Streptomyces griseofuscus TaxID=146922 RepID=UPI0036841FEC